MAHESRAFGPYLKLVTAQTTNPKILNAAQNGGVVTGLLAYALEKRIIDGAVVSALDKQRPFYPLPTMARTCQEIFDSAGTRYTFSPNIQALSEAVRQNMKAIAFVGTPCQIAGVRKMHETTPHYTRSVKLLIGLMCSEAFSYEELMGKYVQNQLGIDLHRVKKTRIAANKMTIITDQNETTVPLIDIKKYARKSCNKCRDFSAELADISAGGLGLRHWTFVVVRTPVGKEIFEQAEKDRALITVPVQMNDLSVKLLSKLAQRKQNREGKQ